MALLKKTTLGAFVAFMADAAFALPSADDTVSNSQP